MNSPVCIWDQLIRFPPQPRHKVFTPRSAAANTICPAMIIPYPRDCWRVTSNAFLCMLLGEDLFPEHFLSCHNCGRIFLLKPNQLCMILSVMTCGQALEMPILLFCYCQESMLKILSAVAFQRLRDPWGSLSPVQQFLPKRWYLDIITEAVNQSRSYTF